MGREQSTDSPPRMRAEFTRHIGNATAEKGMEGSGGTKGREVQERIRHYPKTCSNKEETKETVKNSSGPHPGSSSNRDAN